MIRLVLVVSVYFSLNGLKAQGVDHELWINYAAKVFVNEKLSWGGDAGFRSFLDGENSRTFLVRPTITYRATPVFGFSVAAANFRNYIPDALDLNEVRLQQEVTARWPDFTLFSMFYRLRYEQRFFSTSDVNDFNTRIRYLIGTETKDFRFLSRSRPIYFQLIWEGFNTLTQTTESDFFIDNRRYHVAVGQRLSNQVRIELHYINQDRVADDSSELIDHIFRLRVFQRFN
jgi:hypothetical protein